MTMRWSTLKQSSVLILLGAVLVACGAASVGTRPVSMTGGAVSERLELSTTRVVAGHPISGNVVVVNPGSPIDLSKGCRPGYLVTVKNSHYAPMVVWPTDCVSGPFVIPNGITRLPVVVSTSYWGCSPSGNTTPSFPRCLAGNRMPPLPPGQYEAQVLWEGSVPLPQAPPVTLTLVPQP
jgi:hypothetical protein